MSGADFAAPPLEEYDTCDQTSDPDRILIEWTCDVPSSEAYFSISYGDSSGYIYENYVNCSDHNMRCESGRCIAIT